jgi:hypothetical protein
MEFGRMNREEAHRIIRRAAGDSQPNQGDSLVLSKKGSFEFFPFLFPVKNVSADYTVEGKDLGILVDASSASVDVYLPPSAYAEFRVLFIKKIDDSVNLVDVVPDGVEEIDGSSPVSLSSQWDSLLIVSSGSSWYKL